MGVSSKFLENIKGDERRFKYVSGKCQGYVKSILRVFQESFKCVSRVFKEYKEVSKVEHVSRGFKEGLKEVSRVFFAYFTCVSRVFHRCFKEISLFLSLFKSSSIFD